MPEDSKKAGANPCPHCEGPSSTPDLDAAWLRLPLERRVALLEELGYTFTQEELDFHGAGLPFLHELTVPETNALERMVLGQKAAKAVDIAKTVEERLDSLIAELEGHIFNIKVGKEEVLGVILSKYCRWQGPKILDIAIHALDDANFHVEAAKVQEIAEGLQREAAPGDSSQTGGYDAEGWRNEGEVPSMSGNRATYLVDSHISGRWRCTCPDYVMRRQYNGTDCKHIRAVKQAQEEGGRQDA